MKESINLILRAGMLGASFSAVGRALGYSGRTTLNRLKEGTATDKAVRLFMDRLEARMGLDADDVEDMYIVISNASLLRRHLSRERMAESEGWQLAAVLALAEGDYDGFSNDFNSAFAADLESLREDTPWLFFASLLYFYLTSVHYNFYVKRLNYPEQCQAAFDPVGRALAELYSERPTTRALRNEFVNNSYYRAIDPTLWNFLKCGAVILQRMVDPRAIDVTINSSLLLRGLGGRSYWRTADSDLFVLLHATESDRPGCGIYNVIIFGRSAPQPREILRLLIHDEATLTVLSPDGRAVKTGYSWRDGCLRFDDVVEPLGDVLTLVDMDSAPNLREFDRELTFERLFRLVMQFEGMDPETDDDVEDIVVSRKRLTIRFASGLTVTIDRDRYESLSSVTPDEEAFIATRTSDGVRFVCITSGITIPLADFTVER